jgi:phosphoenolpyruvate synthase/pyruvate phosphate dikinase
MARHASLAMTPATITALSPAPAATPEIVWLQDPGAADRARVGGKAAALAKVAAAHTVPPGFTVVGAVPDDDVAAAYARLAERIGRPDPAVAVRSSAADEDGSETSFAGQHETYLGVVGASEVLEAIAAARASGHSERALAYRRANDLRAPSGPLPILVQALIQADAAAVVFSANPVTGRLDEVLVNSSWGLGESIVGGTVTPDSFTIHSQSLAIVERRLAEKQRMTVQVPGGSREVDVPAPLRRLPSIDEAQARAAAVLALELQREFGHPVDLEVAWAGGELHLLQTRPITTLAQFQEAA